MTYTRKFIETIAMAFVFAIASLILLTPSAHAEEADTGIDSAQAAFEIECGAPSWTEAQRDAFRAEIQKLIEQHVDLGAPPCGVVGPECTIGVDPEPPDIKVTGANLTANGVAIPAFDGTTKTYDGNSPNHLANFPLTGLVFGKAHVTADFTWNVGEGTLHLEGDVTCPEPPPTTTTTPPTTPTTQPPASTVPPKDTDHPTCDDADMANSPACLPRTGSTSVPVAATGAGALGLGALGMVLGRKRFAR